MRRAQFACEVRGSVMKSIEKEWWSYLFQCLPLATLRSIERVQVYLIQTNINTTYRSSSLTCKLWTSHQSLFISANIDYYKILTIYHYSKITAFLKRIGKSLDNISQKSRIDEIFMNNAKKPRKHSGKSSPRSSRENLPPGKKSNWKKVLDFGLKIEKVSGKHPPCDFI